ncbi:zinc ribbon domain-containing protein [Streptomyces massasporeus]|uniref:zinc ribbon domain-containing protein n=1 Tax=Streptomyces massasporeus TaxID=67324 RepID=UPI00369AE7C7
MYVEDLAVSGLAAAPGCQVRARRGMVRVRRPAEYKAVKHGRTFAKVARAFPSSQVCSVCGFRDGPKPLHVREWTRDECATVHDRDHNAARNVLFEGRRIVVTGRVETLKGLWSAGKTGTHARTAR